MGVAVAVDMNLDSALACMNLLRIVNHLRWPMNQVRFRNVVLFSFIYLVILAVVGGVT